MPISSRSRFILATLLVLTLLAWPRAMSWPGVNALPFLFVAFGAVAFVSAVVRAVYAGTGRTPLVPKELALDSAVLVVALLTMRGTEERPIVRSGNRPEGAMLGPLAEVYDPCERGEASVVCSGVVRSVGYACKDGYTMRIHSCPRGACTTTPISVDAHNAASCKDSP